MIFAFTLILLITIFDENTPGNYSIELASGKYKFECWGAQGGDGYEYGMKESDGGKGAYVTGTMTIEGEEILFYLNVGGKGESSPTQQNSGGFNGGGKSGITTANGDKDNHSGGGGGPTDVRIYTNDIENRILVAAGGSGGCGLAQGAWGGTDTGYKIVYVTSDYTEEKSELTTQTKGNSNGIGGDGANVTEINTAPGSGGGGGWMGGVSTGKGGTNVIWGYDTHHEGVAHSGSSYISGYSGYCDTTLGIKLAYPSWKSGENLNSYGNGWLLITAEYACSRHCAYCTTDSKCTKCLENYYLYNNSCVSKCPDGWTAASGAMCQQCIRNCKVCDSSKDTCNKCFDNYYLYNKECHSECPNGTRISDTDNVCEDCTQFCDVCTPSKESCDICKKGYKIYKSKCYLTCPEGTRNPESETGYACEECNENCKTCELSKDICDECEDDFFKFENKCYSECDEIETEGGRYYGKNLIDKTCQECDDMNCIDCSSNYSSCNECSKLYYIDPKTHQCVLKHTGVFTESHPFTFTQIFSLTLDFTKSIKFSKSSKFTESKKFTESNEFTETITFTPLKTHQSVSNPTNIFSESFVFTYSKAYTETNRFSLSDDFSQSSKFSFSFDFSGSSYFSESFNFKISFYKYSLMNQNSETQRFSTSNIFSSSIKFSASEIFSNSYHFTYSQSFTSSNQFISLFFSFSFPYGLTNEQYELSSGEKEQEGGKNDDETNSESSNEIKETISKDNKSSNEENLISDSFHFQKSSDLTETSDFLKYSDDFSKLSRFCETFIVSNSFSFNQDSKSSDLPDFTSSFKTSNEIRKSFSLSLQSIDFIKSDIFLKKSVDSVFSVNSIINDYSSESKKLQSSFSNLFHDSENVKYSDSSKSCFSSCSSTFENYISKYFNYADSFHFFETALLMSNKNSMREMLPIEIQKTKGNNSNTFIIIGIIIGIVILLILTMIFIFLLKKKHGKEEEEEESLEEETGKERNAPLTSIINNHIQTHSNISNYEDNNSDLDLKFWL